MKSRWRGILMVGAVVIAPVFAGCSDDGENITGTGTGDTDTTEASETTSAETPTTTTAAPEATTTAASGGSSSDTDAGSTTSDTSNDALWALAIIAGVLIVGLIVWLASRSGAQRGTTEQAQEDAYGGGAGGDVPPSPPAEGPPE